VSLTQVIQDLQNQIQDMQTELDLALTGITPISSNLYTNGGGTIGEVTNRQPYMGVNYMICVSGVFPFGFMSNFFIGQIIQTASPYSSLDNFLPCNGQLLSISSNTALFSLLGTTYGGDGLTTFAIPDLRSRVAVGVGTGPGLSYYSIGSVGGAE